MSRVPSSASPTDSRSRFRPGLAGRILSVRRPVVAIALFLTILTPLGGSPIRSEQPEDLDIWIGQMLMVGFRGLSASEDDPIIQQIRDLHLGGVILFDYDVPTRTPVRNIRSREQVRALTAALQEAARIPLLIAIDQEGGKVSRLKSRHGFEPSGSQAELGAKDSEAATREQASRTGRTLVGLGVNLNFAPVLDLAVNPDNPIIARLGRSYSSDPARVIKHARWTLQEFRKAGLLSAIKHFPGHGSSLQDSHKGLPDVTPYWSASELEPFERLIGEGLADLVMTAHLFNAKWDPDHPATLSKKVISGMLRGEIGYRGVVVSDDLQMGAIADNYSFEETVELSLRAGVDVLTFANNSSYDARIGRKAFAVIKRLVESGRIPAERIRKSFLRIQLLKQRLAE